MKYIGARQTMREHEWGVMTALRSRCWMFDRQIFEVDGPRIRLSYRSSSTWVASLPEDVFEVADPKLDLDTVGVRLNAAEVCFARNWEPGQQITARKWSQPCTILEITDEVRVRRPYGLRQSWQQWLKTFPMDVEAVS